jgi:hypothetical protein
LGDTFLRGFYSIHDYGGKRFGFAPHSGSKKAAPVAVNSKNKFFHSSKFKIAAVSITTLLIALVVHIL